MIRTLIADDHAVVREGLRQIISEMPDFAATEEAVDGQEVLQKIRSTAFDVLVSDVEMPGMDAVDLIKRVRAERPGTAILVHTMHGAAAIASRLVRAGAAGYVTKDSNREVLISALRKVAAGGRYMDPGVAEQLVFSGAAGAACGDERPLHEHLSDREHQVLLSIAAGKSVGQIAEELHVSPKTVSAHKSRLMQKLGVRTNVELVRYAIAHKLAK